METRSVRRRPLAPRLLALLGFAAGAMSAQPGPWPLPVNGLQGGSVLLAAALAPNASVREIEWSFSSGAGATIQVAEFSRGRLERPDPGDRFKQRLEMFNATALRIWALEPGDSGIYGARVKLHPAVVQDQSFSLSVYEPVGAPEIDSELLAWTPHECNVSLRCRAPAGRDVHVAWLLDAAPGHRPPAEDRLEVHVGAGTLNATYTCVASNPVQQRSTSVHLQTLCRDGPAAHAWRRWHVYLALLLVAVAAVLAAIWLWKKRRKKAAAGGTLAASSEEEEAPLEPQYAQIQRREPPAAGKRRPEQCSHVSTIYDQGGGKLHPPARLPHGAGPCRPAGGRLERPWRIAISSSPPPCSVSPPSFLLARLHANPINLDEPQSASSCGNAGHGSRRAAAASLRDQGPQ
ncbi:SLAM family member 5-like [Dromaius novaehollandiae]|uniref:SLAM family member 5-like n=1 Tax=Dromaius novaehollandiae TaxID=8790 RepID=UPI00311E79BD